MERRGFRAGLALILVAISSFAYPQSVFPQMYALTDLGTLGGTESFAYVINDNEQIIGVSRMPGDAENHIFLYEKGSLTDISQVYGIVAGSWEAMPNDINNSGQIVGNDSNGQSMFLSTGAKTDLGTVGGMFSTVNGINNLSQMVGYYSSPDSHNHAFLYENGQMTPIGSFGAEAISIANAINDSGMVVGEATDSYTENYHAFLYVNGRMTDISPWGSSESYARDINGLGQVVGEFLTPDGKAFHAFLYSEGVFIDLGSPDSPETVAFAINDQGQVVGTTWVPYQDVCIDPNTGQQVPCIKYKEHAFLYENGEITDLNSLIPSDSAWELSWAFDVNNKGQIVGYGLLNGKFRAFLLSPLIDITLDIKRGDRRNSINPKAKGRISVAILATEGFDPTRQVDIDSLGFGRTGDEKSLASCRGTTILRSGAPRDLVCQFYTQAAGFQCGDTRGILKGTTKDGMPIEGSDVVKIGPCK